MQNNNSEPGVSGKSETGKSWLNAEKYHQQVDHLVADEKLEELVLLRFKDSETVDPNIRVFVEDQVVTLSGEVTNAQEARAFIKLAEGVVGVREIINHIRVLEDPKLI